MWAGIGGRFEMESVEVYSGMLKALEKITKEATVLAEHNQQIRKYNMTLKKLNTSFDQVQSRLVRVAVVKPSLSRTVVQKET